jgi:hypothetical protein
MTSTPVEPEDCAHFTVRDLRRRWKPSKERLRDEMLQEPLRIRMHRAFSWMDRVERMGPDAEPDDLLLFRWIALNSLYATWDEETRRPGGDREDLRNFLTRIEMFDRDHRLATMLGTHWKLLVKIIEDPYLTRLFWEISPDEGVRTALELGRRAAIWGDQGRVGRIMGELLDRIYFLRCQIMHGAATHGSGRNRRSVERCAEMLEHVLREMTLVMIDHGPGHDWGPAPYPPV